ncbi:MAG: peptidylprolyl isomerase [Desulfobacterales bacterium]|nr:peptidylprolyl isomerase [Desulfobacterales bacterium]MDJ0875349.1 peptidylprolyl isomerase [Desulfobacterales bacterium]
MTRLVLVVLVLVLMAAPVLAGGKPQVRLETTKGLIIVELEPRVAPKTVENFLRYVREGFYNGTIFHRVIKDFMIQGGGMMTGMIQKTGHDPIRNEASRKMLNTKGTIAMARTSNPHSATSQFFINTKDNPNLDFQSRSRRGWGYCVFGRVIKGMEVVERIEEVATMSVGGHRDVPRRAVVIERAVEVTP